jgi:hypothetical protein
MTSLFPPRESLVVTSRRGTGNSRTFFYGVLFLFNLSVFLQEVRGGDVQVQASRLQVAGGVRGRHIQPVLPARHRPATSHTLRSLRLSCNRYSAYEGLAQVTQKC